jgi:hypothetical protein
MIRRNFSRAALAAPLKISVRNLEVIDAIC